RDGCPQYFRASPRGGARSIQGGAQGREPGVPLACDVRRSGGRALRRRSPGGACLSARGLDAGHEITSFSRDSGRGELIADRESLDPYQKGVGESPMTAYAFFASSLVIALAAGVAG